MRTLFIAIALFVMSAAPCLAVEVLIVQSGNGAAYAEAIRGFREVFGGATQTILLSDYADVDLVRIVKEEQPRLVLAVGDPALAKAKKVRQVPVISLLALGQGLPRPAAGNIHGVSVAPAPVRYMQLFSGMGAKKVGVVYDPSRTGNYLKRALAAADNAGIRLVAREVKDPRTVVATIDQFKGVVDAVWMVPDTTAVTTASLEAYFGFSARNKVPVIAFSELYLPKGAAASIDVDRVDMGRQAGELATSLLKGGSPAPGTLLDPRKLEVNSNTSIAQKLGLKIPDLIFPQK
ncbi:ABC transporter substrate binding protein [Geobacter sp. OR-1]|uniref:ABC transporter substrate-binding protein n=1 Tax=Geobacter sp. OR-1 TaxID=1266765 RepID=UPI000544045B|nr:ABC transporter substrate binding protein [Geobacter sp. OR-1]GAM07968.1 ABC transporter substrate binding protein [Geobacter sp. OR-1]